MPVFIISILIQIALVIHVVKTGRNTTWIWIVVMLPLAGSIAYLVVEVLPDILKSRTGRRAGKKIKSVVNPDAEINEAAERLSISGTVENSMKLAEECYAKGFFSEAKSLYTKCLTGPLSDDPHLLFGLAKSDFEMGNFDEVKSTLDTLIELNPEYKNPEAHLLYARALEQLNDIAAALEEYETLHKYFAGPKASFYFVKFLKSQNQNDRAEEICQEIINVAKNAGNHYNSKYKEFVDGAKNEVSIK